MIAFPEKVGAFVMKTKYVSCLDGARFLLFYLVTLPAVPRMLKFFVQYLSSFKSTIGPKSTQMLFTHFSPFTC